MKKLVVLSLIILTFVSCSNTNQGELVGVRKQSKQFYYPDPYGMVFVPLGSYTMGVGGQDVASSQVSQPKTISVSSFYMDQTEITNNEYREFVYWVRDSIARKFLSEGENGDAYLISQDPKTGEANHLKNYSFLKTNVSSVKKKSIQDNYSTNIIGLTFMQLLRKSSEMTLTSITQV